MLSKYSFFGKIHLFISLVYTKVFFNKLRLIRIPFDIRNKKNISFEEGFTCGKNCRIEAYPSANNKKSIIINIGKNVQINDYVHIAGSKSIKIGDNSLLASKIFISDISHGNYNQEFQDSPLSIPSSRKLYSKEIEIGKNVWIGESVCILPGVKIGDGSIIGALSVVTKNIPPYSIAVGSPAKVVKKYDFKENKWIQIK